MKKIREDYAIIYSIIILYQIGMMIFYAQKFGDQKMIQDIIRLILISTLIFFTVLNKNWAKWILSILSILAGLSGLLLYVFMYFLQNPIGGMPVLLTSAYFLFAGIYTISTKNKIII